MWGCSKSVSNSGRHVLGLVRKMEEGQVSWLVRKGRNFSTGAKSGGTFQNCQAKVKVLFGFKAYFYTFVYWTFFVHAKHSSFSNILPKHVAGGKILVLPLLNFQSGEGQTTLVKRFLRPWYFIRIRVNMCKK